MMRQLVLLGGCFVGLMGCVPQATPEQKAVFAENTLRAAVQPAGNRTVVDTSTYVVDANPARTVAYVTPVAGLQHNIDRMERAAMQRTGCTAKAQPQVYDLMRGSQIVSIPTVRIQRFGGRFPMDLTC